MKIQQQEGKLQIKHFFSRKENWNLLSLLTVRLNDTKVSKLTEEKNPVLSFQSQNFHQLFILGPRITNKRMLINKELSFKHVGKFYWALFAWHATSKCEKFPPSRKETRASKEEHSIIKSKHFGILTLLLLIHWKSFTIVRDLYKTRSAKKILTWKRKWKLLSSYLKMLWFHCRRETEKGNSSNRIEKVSMAKFWQQTEKSLWWKTSYKKQIKRKWISNNFFMDSKWNLMP